jgi:23S rRNA pseudouridine2605 synthase
MGSEPFRKFINKKSNAAIKEKFKQEKKAAKKQRAASIEKYYQEKRERARKRRTDLHPRQAPAKTVFNPKEKDPEPMPLNKYLSHCGVASRRESVEIIKKGSIMVNGEIITEPAHRVSENDQVELNGKRLNIVKDMVYILLNKPKDFITTSADPHNRKTVMQLVKNATQERVFAVGRLDRNTSGVLLLTNDGELTQRLTHPSFNVEKIYEVKLDKPLTKAHFTQILEGIILEDGEIHADDLAYADQRDKSVIGIEMHSGRNRIVRRIFEHFGYEIKHLDRVMYAGLTKKNVERGKWRYLNEKEIRSLKHLNRKNKPAKKNN